MYRRTILAPIATRSGVMSEQAMEKVCPECAETVKPEARVCRFCGYRFDGVEPASAPSSPRAALPSASNFGKHEWFLVWGSASAVFMLIGAFGPWLKALGQSVSGTDGGNDGWGVVAIAVIAGLLFFASRGLRAAGWWPLIGGAIATFVTVHDRNHVSNAISHGGALAQALVHVGWGLNLAMVASISFAIAGLVWLMRSEESGDSSPLVALNHLMLLGGRRDSHIDDPD
jgi:ribosomal protein L40E